MPPVPMSRVKSGRFRRTSVRKNLKPCAVVMASSARASGGIPPEDGVEELAQGGHRPRSSTYAASASSSAERDARGVQRAHGPRRPLARHPLRALQPEERRVGGLPRPGVLAGRLAQLGVRAGDVQHVVHDLKGQPQLAAVRRERLHPPRVRPRRQRADAQRRGQQGARLEAVDALQPVRVHPRAGLLAQQVQPLAAHHPPRAAGPAQLRHQPPARPASSPRSRAAPSSTPTAAGMSAAPASSAARSPNATCTVGRPRRRASSSMDGRSSCTSE